MNASTTVTLKRPQSQKDIIADDGIQLKKHKIEDEVIYKLFAIIVIDQLEEFEQNTVWMHRDDVRELFGVQNSPQNYIKIAKSIYKVAIRNIKVGSICLSNTQKREVRESIARENGKEALLLSPYNVKFEKSQLQSLSLRLEMSNFPLNLTVYDYNELQMLCKNKMVGSFVNLNQKITLDLEKPTIITQIKTVNFAVANLKAPFGFVTNDTNIIFENISSGNTSLTIVRQQKNDFASFFRFSVTLKDKIKNNNPYDDLYDSVEGSLLVDYDIFAHAVMECCKSRSLFKGSKCNVYLGKTSFEINLEAFRGFENMIMPQNCQRGMHLCNKTELRFTSRLDEIIFVKDPPHFAKTCVVKVVDVIESANDHLSSNSIAPWINVDELKNALTHKWGVAIGQKFEVQLGMGTYLVKLEQAEKYEADMFPVHSEEAPFRSTWGMDVNTHFNFNMDPNLTLKFIQNSLPIDISTIDFEVSLFASLKRQRSEQTIEVLELELEEAIEKEIYGPIIAGQTFEVTIADQKLLLTAKNISFKDEVIDHPFAHLGNFKKETNFRFLSNSKTELSIIAKKGELHADKLIETLNAAGLGGMNKQLNQLIRRVVIFQDIKLKVLAERLGVKPVKGMILYGPPGTGKTTLARNFSKYVGCTPERTKLVSSPEIFDKYVGVSEKKIRDLFQDAKDAQEKYGDKSPLYTIVFDEFDSIASKRDDRSGRWLNSVVDQLLAEIDGLTQLNNILVIGITNRLDSLDPAITRAGRFEFHLEIGLPDEDGRLEIFDIYTRQLVKENLLAKDVDLKLLAKQTEEFSGADIESLVRLACTYPLDRSFKSLDKTFEKMSVEDEKSLTLVTKKDFQKALKEINAQKKKEDKDVPFGMYG